MTSKILLTFFLLKASLIFAQADKQSVDFTQVYYPIINDAEMAIIDSNYVDALDLYKGAFQNVEKPFAKDFYNAALCAFYADRQNVMFEYLEKLAEKGLPYDSLKKDTFFKLVIDTTAKWKKFEIRYRNVKSLINKDLRDSLVRMNERLSDYYRKSQNTTMYYYFGSTIRDKKKFDSLANRLMDAKNVKMKIALDKILLDSMGKEKKLYDKIKENNALLDSIARVESKIGNQIQDENYVNLIRIIDEYGFPDENLVGLSLPSLESELAINVLENRIYKAFGKGVPIFQNHHLLPKTIQKKKSRNF